MLQYYLLPKCFYFRPLTVSCATNGTLPVPCLETDGLNYIDGDAGTITSPGYPSVSYSNGLQCHWRLRSSVNPLDYFLIVYFIDVEMSYTKTVVKDGKDYHVPKCSASLTVNSSKSLKD